MISIDIREQINSIASELCLDPFTVKYLHKRFRKEGIQFLTVTLPLLSKAVLRSLELGYFERPTNFSWHERSLRFCRSLLDAIFDHRTGKVLPNVDPLALYSLRSLCEYFYKLALPFDEADLDNAEEAFVKEEDSLERSSFDWDFIELLRKDFETHHSYSTQVHSDVFKHQRPYLTPGTFSGKTSEAYYVHKTRPLMVPTKFKADSGVFKPYPSAPLQLELGNDTANYSEVLFVPKDSRGPRTIVREPMVNLAAQMSFHVWLRDNLNRTSSGRVNFVNQQVNRDLAQASSISKEFCTLDLKNASDRVAYCVVKHITQNSPAFRYFLKHRTEMTKLPSGKLMKLRKIAGMGSGLTFPTMSLLIYLAAVRAISSARVSYKDAMLMCYVYGDDIIVPSRYAEHVTSALQKVGLQLNCTKSFKHSHFRESCGGDYYDGQDVGPLRLKLSNCENRVNQNKLVISGTQALLQVERHARECVKHGFIALAECYYRAIERKYGKLPEVSGDSPILGRYKLNLADSPDLDEYGNYAKGKYLCALPVKSPVEDMNPYVYLATKLTQDLGGLARNLFHLDKSCGSTYGEISIPRRVRYARAERSVLDLTLQAAT